MQQLGAKSTHVVRLTVLGLAGVTVDRLKCRDKVVGKLNKSIAPAEPFNMKAVVAFSRNSNIKGLSALSKRLARSPSDDIVVGQQGELQEPDDETDTDTTGTLDRPQRHVAVWASDSSALGSVVTFEANLKATGQARFAPKSFDLTIALAEDDNSEHKFALPFGVSTLAISGEECKAGKPIKLDLPVLSLAAANPLNKDSADKKKGLGEYPMIAISPKPDNLPKKRTALQRLFKRHQKAKVPTELTRSAFASAYSMDANGDAILRVSMEVFEKGSDLEKALAARRLLGDHSVSTTSNHRSVAKEVSEVPFDERARKCSLTGAPSDEDDTLFTNEDTLRSREEGTLDGTYDGTYDGTFDGTYDGTYEGTFDGTYDGTFDGTYDGTYDGTFEGTHGSTYDGTYDDIYADLEDDDDDSEGSETYATNEDTVGFFAWHRTESKEADSYTLSFEKAEEREKPMVQDDEIAEEIDPVEIDFFGRKIQIPFCGSLPLMNTHRKNESGSIVSRETKGRLDRLVHDIQDDMTHVTADFFGKSYSIPVCAAIRGNDDDDLTFLSAGDTMMDTETRADLDMNQTFSTLSDRGNHQANPSTPIKTPKRQTNRKERPLTPASAKDWLLSPNSSDGKKKKATTEAGTDTSPTAIRDFPPPATKKKQPEPEGMLGKSFSNFFNFTSAATQSAAVKYEPYQAEVPPLIIPDEDASVGDLTANTHEMNIASEAEILERYRKKFHAQSKTTRKQSRSMLIPVPIAFGGTGMCPGVSVPSASSPIRVTSGCSNSLLEAGVVTRNENYFAEYDEFSLAPPRGAKPKVDEASPEYKPIEMTITGYQASTDAEKPKNPQAKKR